MNELTINFVDIGRYENEIEFLCVFVFIAFNVTNAIRPTYLYVIKSNGGSRNEIIRAYFEHGYSYKDISAFLQTLHNITLSVTLFVERSDSGKNSMNQVNSFN